MGSEWRSGMLGDFCTLQRGFDLPARDRRPGIVPIVSSSGVSDYHDEAPVKGPGVVTGRYGTIGEVYYVESDYWPLNTTLWVKDFKGNDPRFIYYFLKTVDYQSCNDKSGVPGLNRNDLHALAADVPDVGEQRAIAGVLGALDDKIAANRRLGRTLEALGRAVFRSWFVDFDPVTARAAGRRPVGMTAAVADLFPATFADSPLGPIPAGWRVAAVADLARYVNGRNFTKDATGTGRMVIRIAELNSGPGGSTVYNDVPAPPENTAFPGDLLFAWSGSLDVYRWHGDAALVNQHIFKVIPADYPQWFVHYHLIEAMPFFQGIAADKATTMGHIKREHLSHAELALPPAEVLAAADMVIQPLYVKLHQCERQSRTLAGLRDALLPRLLSGELRVRAAGRRVGEAT